MLFFPLEHQSTDNRPLPSHRACVGRYQSVCCEAFQNNVLVEATKRHDIHPLPSPLHHATVYTSGVIAWTKEVDDSDVPKLDLFDRGLKGKQVGSPFVF